MRFFVLLFTVVIAGCSSVELPPDAYSTEPTLAPKTNIGEIIKALPPAQQKVAVAVYDFEDHTGQAKPSDSPQASRAVTQGAISILKKALFDAGDQSWFRVLERGGLSNLLQERKIIRVMRQNYAGPKGEQLSSLDPLMYAGLLLEGGVIAYESNVTTGGAGARYLGIGGSTEYQRDMVTVYLRAISVRTGEVLLAVNTSKTVYSTKVSGGSYYFVSFDKLFESEAGYTKNEPPQLAVRQAVEMAVYALIMDGYRRGVWKFADEAQGRSAFLQYLKRRHPSSDGESSQEKPVESAAVKSAREKAEHALVRHAAMKKAKASAGSPRGTSARPAAKKAQTRASHSGWHAVAKQSKVITDSQGRRGVVVRYGSKKQPAAANEADSRVSLKDYLYSDY